MTKYKKSNAFSEVFLNQKFVSIICERLGVPNIWHPLYKQDNYKKYTDEEIEERRKEQNKEAQKKY